MTTQHCPGKSVSDQTDGYDWICLLETQVTDVIPPAHGLGCTAHFSPCSLSLLVCQVGGFHVERHEVRVLVSSVRPRSRQVLY